MLVIVPLKHCIDFAYCIATLPQFILFIRIYRVTIRTWLHDWQIKTLGDSMSCTVRLFETAAPLGGLILTPLLAKMWIYASTKHVWSLRDYQADLRAGDLHWIAEILNYVLCCGKHIHDLFRDVCFNIFSTFCCLHFSFVACLDKNDIPVESSKDPCPDPAVIPTDYVKDLGLQEDQKEFQGWTKLIHLQKYVWGILFS